MQEDHQVRVFVSHLVKQNEQLQQRIEAVEHHINALNERMFKPNMPKDPDKPSNLGPPEGHKATTGRSPTTSTK